MFQSSTIAAALAMSVLLGGAAVSLLHAGNADAPRGKRIYVEVCQACHGADGKGAGVMQFLPPAADLTSRQVQEKLDSGLYTSIHEGRANTAMGAWKHALSDQEIRDVIAYVRTFGVSLPNP
jgi:mono/diheme cytochrome c family protein